jgi:D-sedoheptulose 7-phosphate isomerase
MLATPQITGLAAHRLVSRNAVYEAFFAREADRLARASQEMANRFLRGGRLLAFGRGACATDAQHVSVEFVHPVIVGKRALPGLDLSTQFGPWVDAIAEPKDIVMGFGPPGGDPEIDDALSKAAARGAMTFALPGRSGAYAVQAFSADPLQHQEIVEILYHTLWETVHVFFEHRELESEAGAAGFLYPFLGGSPTGSRGILDSVASSIQMKVQEDSRLRSQMASEQAAAITHIARVLGACRRNGGTIFFCGNGGSATDANDWTFDCISPPAGMRPARAVSLAAEPAVLTAIANDIGTDAIFLRQLIAHTRPGDVVVAISTSGGSANLLLALEEAARRNLTRVALLGYDGGEILRRGLADLSVVVPCDYIPRVQEVQASIYHVIRELMEIDSDA